MKLGFVGWLRWAWRQLLTMRVALYLLLLLGLAAIPGSVFPQRTASPAKVQQYFTEHPDLAVWLDRFRMFDVYGSPWFSATYILLLISLTGCVIPRTRQLIKDLRTPLKSPSDAIWQSAGTPLSSETLSSLTHFDVKRRFRFARISQSEGQEPNSASSRAWFVVDAGWFREVANISFHASMLGILLSVASGSLFGYHGQVIVREQTSFTNSIAQYDSFSSGRLFQTSNLAPFNLALKDLKVTYQNQGRQAGDAIDYAATVVVNDTDTEVIGVNDPLTVGNASVFLIGHGYAPVFKVQSATGETVFDDSVVFLPKDRNFSSEGVVKLPDLNPQLGLDGIFAPTAVVTESEGPHSLFPEMIDPKVFLSAWSGDLGLDTGIAQNIYVLDKTNLKRIGTKALTPGESWTLPDGSAKITFVGAVEFATFNVNSDPGQGLALFFGVLAVVSLTLMVRIRRYRFWLLRDSAGWRLVVPELQDEDEIASLTQRF